MKFYEGFLAKFSRLGARVSDLSRINALMSAVGEPHKKLKFIHIAGTNGKGSCAQMLSNMLVSAGCSTGLFTSPYIIRYNDRIRVNNADIPDDELDRTARFVADRLNAADITCGFSQFEITQAIAFVYFLQKNCDVVVCETGLGGLLDSTNIIPEPLVSVICSVSFDHTEILGSTIEAIALQKAGIIKPHRPCVLAPDNDEKAVRVISEYAKKQRSPLIIPDMTKLKIMKCTPFGNEFEFCSKTYQTQMGGIHQIKNALTVICCAEILQKSGFAIGMNDIRAGLSAAVPARMQIISRSPLVILDGSHNPDSVSSLAAALKTLGQPKKIMIGMLSGKDSEGAAGLLASAAERIVCVDGFYTAARDKNTLAEILKNAGANASASEYDPIETARREILSLKENEAFVICGSLYLASLFADGKILDQALADRNDGIG